MPDNDVTLQELHFRRIDMRGFQRSDGLFEVHGQVVDRKTEDFVPWSGQHFVAAGDPIHDLGVRLVFDAQMTVLEVSTTTSSAPYNVCSGGGDALQTLVGLRMTSGWTREVRSRLSGARSCTHMMELLTPMATTAFQTLGFIRRQQPQRLDENGRPVKIDSCYAYGADREVVLHQWPQFHRSPKNTDPNQT